MAYARYQFASTSWDERPLPQPYLASSSASAVVPLEAMRARQKAISELARFMTFRPNWDGHGAAKPDRESLISAGYFLLLCSPTDDWEPTIHADGRAILELDREDLYVEATFGPASSVTLVQRRAGERAQVQRIDFDRKRLPLEAHF